MLLSPLYATLGDRIRIALLVLFCALVLAFLVLPIFVPVPLSVNSEAFFTYPLKGFSWRWYRDVLGSGQWQDAIWHSMVIAIGVTVLATSLGTLAAVGLSSPSMPARRSIMAGRADLAADRAGHYHPLLAHICSMLQIWSSPTRSSASSSRRRRLRHRSLW